MKDCACKGIRTCLKCEPSRPLILEPGTDIEEYIYCYKCVNRAFLPNRFPNHACRQGSSEKPVDKATDMDSSIVIDGVFLQPEVITTEEESELVSSIDSHQWMDSQSGRRKQDFGPKINFKKRKINFDAFVGLPRLDMTVLETIKSERINRTNESCRFDLHGIDAFQQEVSDNILRNFRTVEVCHLEYMPERGSSIDAHFDDFWIWGERLVTLNLLSSTVISLSHSDSHSGTLIRVPLPARSLLVLYGDARYKYKHAIARSHVHSRRLAITYRELSVDFLCTGRQEYADYGRRFIHKASVRIS